MAYSTIDSFDSVKQSTTQQLLMPNGAHISDKSNYCLYCATQTKLSMSQLFFKQQ